MKNKFQYIVICMTVILFCMINFLVVLSDSFAKDTKCSTSVQCPSPPGGSCECSCNYGPCVCSSSSTGCDCDCPWYEGDSECSC